MEGSQEIPVFDLQVPQEDLDAVAETLSSGWWTMGPRVAEFERAFADQLGCAEVVATSSCTAALHLSMLCAGVGEGDEVIVPSFTFVATAAAVLYTGATPVFADIVGQNDLGVDPDHVEELLSERTKAVVTVHYAGYPAAVDRLERLCSERGLALIEDSAHAPSATFDGRKLGTFGLAGAFSFFPNKVLAVGEGGALATDDEEVATRARALRSHAMTTVTWERHRGHALGYDVTDVGFNYRMDEPRAALLLSRLGRLEGEIERRRAIVARYRAALQGLSGVTVPYLDEQVGQSSCFAMAVMVDDPEHRDEVRERMREQGVRTTVMYPGIHEFTAYRERFPGVSLPRTELASRSQIALPLFSHMEDGQVDRVVEALEGALG
ncbi:MAG TPA: DegT/DnrJ/EryC1/StrS family aminotransferase [Solirubrobacterales bacterium]